MIKAHERLRLDACTNAARVKINILETEIKLLKEELTEQEKNNKMKKLFNFLYATTVIFTVVEGEENALQCKGIINPQNNEFISYYQNVEQIKAIIKIEYEEIKQLKGISDEVGIVVE